MPSSLARSSLIAVTNRVYMGQFRLAAARPDGVAKAFEIIQNSRGRSVADFLRFGARRPGDTPSPAELKIIWVQRRIRMVFFNRAAQAVTLWMRRRYSVKNALPSLSTILSLRLISLYLVAGQH